MVSNNRLVELIKTLDKDQIDMKKLRAGLFRGIPCTERMLFTEDEVNGMSRTERLGLSLRGICWRLMLNVYSSDC